MRKVIVGVHGLGNKPSKEILEQWWWESMAEGLKSIKSDAELPEFELVYWGDILNEKQLDPTITDKENALYLDEAYAPAPKDYHPANHPIRLKLMSFLEKNMDKYFLNNDLSLNYSFISDSIIKKYFYEVDVYFTKDCEGENGYLCTARDKIKERLIDVLKKYEKDDVFLITHSSFKITRD